MEIWNVAFLEYNTAFRSGFHVPIKNIQSGRISSPGRLLGNQGLPDKQIAHGFAFIWAGRRHVDLELLKGQMQASPSTMVDGAARGAYRCVSIRMRHTA